MLFLIPGILKLNLKILEISRSTRTMIKPFEKFEGVIVIYQLTKN